MQREAFEDILDQEFEEMPSQKDFLGRLKVAVLRRRLDGGEYRVERRICLLYTSNYRRSLRLL